MTTVYITPAILTAINTIAAAGHGIELKMGEGGNSHTVTYITIGCRKIGEAGYTKKLTVKHTSSYGGKFSEFNGVDREFGDLCFGKYKTINGLVAAASRLA